jgi:hypothetical protein
MGHRSSTTGRCRCRGRDHRRHDEHARRERRKWVKRRLRLLNTWRGVSLVAICVGLVLTACGSSGTSLSSGASPASALRSYLAAVEPIRLGVNDLLEGADPILDSYQAHHSSGNQAAAAMSRLEQSFAKFMVEINALQPADATLTGINAPYAHTYILEDSYLNALVAALPDGDFASLPNTQSQQREAIIAWRVQLEILANAASVVLPADLQQAGRGEIAPSVTESS